MHTAHACDKLNHHNHCSCTIPPSLEGCPDDIVELFAKLLDLEDICNLRLTCMTLSAKVSRACFHRMLRSTYVDLTPNELRARKDRLQMRNGVPQVEHLYIIGLAPQLELQNQGEEETGLLQEVFSELSKSNNGDVRLSLTVRLTVILTDGTRISPAMEDCSAMPKHVRHYSTKTCHATLRALAASQLRIRKLNGFNEADMKCCSIPGDQVCIANEIQGSGLAKSLKDLESLSLSICNKVPGDDKPESRLLSEACKGTQKDEHLEEAENPDLSGVAKLISLSPNLESINLHYYYVYGHTFGSEKILQHVVELKQLPTLRDCTIRGLSVRAEDMLDFVTRTSPSNLALRNIRLYQGKFDSIIKYCTSDTANAEALLLDTLYEEESPGIFAMVLFDKVKSQAGIINGSEKQWWKNGKDKQPISFSVAQPQFMGSPYRVIYNKQRQLEHGGFRRTKW